jgi:bifunctional UDP-N-acetylglucosamine pyrophosphorylase/glucosamine-1-phosphate N-acetyltransferase
MNTRIDSPLEVIVLAAGKGRRMISDKPKVLHELAGEPLLGHVLRSVKGLRPRTIHVVLGYGADQVRDRFADENVQWVVQHEQLGTGHAVKTALPGVGAGSQVLIVYGDIPLVDAAELGMLVDSIRDGDIALLTANFADPQGYGRIIRDGSGKVVDIVEQKDASAGQLALAEVNTGFIAAGRDALACCLERVTDQNAQAEQYLTDIVAIAAEQGLRIVDVPASAPVSVIGVNTKSDLAVVERHYQRQRAADFLKQGVTIVDPARFDARGDIQFGKDCVVEVNVILEGPMEIGNGVCIGPHSIVRRSNLGNGVLIKAQSIIEDAEIGAHAVVGPFARVRPGTRLAHNVQIGNFVEIKNSDLGPESKVNHLSYVGDSTLGRGVNIGAGVITCNYDGANKYRTEIADDVFVGSGSQLVAPVTVGRGATIGAGSTITGDVPPEILAVSRVPQQHINGWQRPRKKAVKRG